ncbi:Hypothetical protein, putative [Bodo saltans]|uniref:Uncharacterized protein n=1 Tax=Bodo saltans TaxID=75058 RepID=A0A0S4J7L4_BODSA|nr:Hypothetical protein, putative [Bodo saltans]|eukprot:CUG86052.1 Hypothetical protein, putative [Bodo saltans]
MPSFFSKLFSPKKDKSGAAAAVPPVDTAAADTTGRVSPQPPAERSASAQPAERSASGQPNAAGEAPRSASQQHNAEVPRSASARSASPAPVPAHGSFVREDSATSHVSGPPPPPGTKILVPAPRGGMKIVVPPPRTGPTGFHPPPGAGMPPAHPPPPSTTASVAGLTAQQSQAASPPPELNETVAGLPPPVSTPVQQVEITPREESHIAASPIDVSDSDSDDIMFAEEGGEDIAEFGQTTNSVVPQLEMPTWGSQKSTPQDTPQDVHQLQLQAAASMPREASQASLSGAAAAAAPALVLLKSQFVTAADVAALRASSNSTSQNGSPLVPSVYNTSMSAQPLPAATGSTRREASEAQQPSQPRAQSKAAAQEAVASSLTSRLERPAPQKQPHRVAAQAARKDTAETTTTFTATSTTSVDKQRVADLFFSILCPQQYFGKVLRVRDIRSVSNGSKRAASPHKTQRTITVATKNGRHDLFYPLVRLDQNDISGVTGSGSSIDDEEQRTAITLFQAAPGNMGFAEDIAAAEELLRASPDMYSSCYVLSHSGIVLRDIPVQATPVASLNLCWAPFYSEAANGMCSLHSVPYELFDMTTRELLCALCLAKAPQERRGANVTVLSELMSEPVARRVYHTLNAKVHDSNRMIHKLVSSHQKVVDNASRQCSSIDRQFDMLAAALEAKRAELKEQAREDALSSAGNIAKDILSADEHVHIMRSASDHIQKTDTLKPLQLGTIANAMAVAEQIDVSNRSRDGGYLGNAAAAAASVAGNVTINLEHAMHAMQRITIDSSNTPLLTSASTSSGNLLTGRASSPNRGPRQPYGGAVTPGRPSSTVRVVSPHRSTQPTTTPRRNMSPVRGASKLTSQPTQVVSVASSPSRYTTPVSARRLSGTGFKDGSNSARRNSNPASPLLTGIDASNVFSTPIHQLLTHEGAAVSWTLRIQDPGDWVGVGVGVGAIGAVWRNVTRPGEAASDLSHLWIVPSRAPRVLVLRVTMTNGIARLTVHDKSGKQLDDGRIAHWHALRSCFPQVTFGGRVGSVALLREPTRVVSVY